MSGQESGNQSMQFKSTAELFEDFRRRDEQFAREQAREQARARRERIATACLAGMLANPNRVGRYEYFAADASAFASALIAELDKEQP